MRKRAILYGMVIAAVLRIVFAVIATTLFGHTRHFICRILFYCFGCAGACFEKSDPVYNSQPHSNTSAMSNTDAAAPEKTMAAALISITIADVSMSLDNVLAVAAIADGDRQMLIFGLGLAIILMAFAATIIMKLLTKFPWISWLGLIVLLYVAGEMLYRGFFDIHSGVGPLLGLVEGWEISKSH